MGQHAPPELQKRLARPRPQGPDMIRYSVQIGPRAGPIRRGKNAIFRHVLQLGYSYWPANLIKKGIE